MKRLLILRHAKSSWAEPDQSDHDRPLNPRGRRAARALGGWIRSEALIPDEILCSTAARTVETAARLGLGPSPSPTLRPELYLAEPDTLLSAVRGASGQIVLLLAHNPGIAEFAALCLRTPPRHARFQDYPTGALTVADFAIDTWRDVQFGTARCHGFVIPADLPDPAPQA